MKIDTMSIVSSREIPIRNGQTMGRISHEITSTFGVVHATAVCDDCGWETSYYKNAQANASRHARAKGHTVSVEVGLYGKYKANPKARKTVPTS